MRREPKKNRTPAFNHPFDNPLNSGLRFLVEVVAWVAGPWAVAEVHYGLRSLLS